LTNINYQSNIMKKRTRSILEELNSIIPEKSKHVIIENRAEHIIHSCLNLLQQIEENFSPEEAEELQKRFFSSLRNKDPQRFERGIKKMQEPKNV